jgi:hypothetical protein
MNKRNATAKDSRGFHVSAHSPREQIFEVAICDLKDWPRWTAVSAYAFTEHGAIMAATVLNSEQAVEMSVFVVRAFVRLREMLAANRELADRIGELEKHLETHDGTIQEIINVIKSLMTQPSRRRTKDWIHAPSTRTG